MKKFSNSPEHIYIHWPFCQKKCHYCDFISFQSHEGFEKKYHEALCNNVKNFVEQNYASLKSNKIKTIFFGGGSPSLYPLDLFEKFMDLLKESFDLSCVEEITLEANPADVTEEKLDAWKKFGITRLSLGVQVLDNKVLKDLNRFQTVEDVYKTMEMAPKSFDNISVDLILGLPGTTKDSWQKTLNEAVSWPIKHLSVYILMLYKKTPLYFRVKEKEIKVLQEDEISELYLNTVEFLKKNKFNQYEISNFSKQNFESKHNLAYWNRRSYVGFGLGASSFDGATRYVNEKKLNKYLDACNKNKSIIDFSEDLDRQQVLLEKLMLGLRLRKGVGLQGVLYSLSNDEKIKFLDNLKVLKSQSLVEEQEGRIFLTTKGMMLENEVVLKLI